MTKLENILDQLSDNFLDLKNELTARSDIESSGERRQQFVAARALVEQTQAGLNALIYSCEHPLAVCWMCDKEEPLDEFKRESECFPQRICHKCFDKIPHGVQRSRWYWMTNSKSDRFAKRHTLTDLGIKYTTTFADGRVETNITH